MPENPSKTSNHQRIKEMMCHLTPEKAVIPYNVCFDDSNNLWVASKGGLFKFDSSTKKLLFSMKNDFPKKIAAYPQILVYKTKLIYVTGDPELIQFRILDQLGNVEHESFIEGKVQSLAITKQGDLFMTKQMKSANSEQIQNDSDESIIWRSHMDFPAAWDEFASSFDECFQCLCLLDDETLAVSVASIPVNIYSKQSIKLLNIKTGQFIGKPFSTCGKEKGQIFFPRCMRSCNQNNFLLIMDKTGRFQKFNKNGDFIEISAKIDDYIGNGFTLKNDEEEAVIACSGIVLDEKGESICDDWIESIKLDGSRWTED
ncbi:hypothetical protein ACQ4LE_007198 [Meloidogyne hapla]|uniref:Uncharacterized protein n=1 Tax=Meloidogyne hapla TaxID=6305 RepID=A0A1I8B0I5_MELHA